MAREAALVTAERNLAKIIHGAYISSKTTVKNAAVADDEIQSRVDGLVRGATVVEERELEDGSYEVALVLKTDHLPDRPVAIPMDLVPQGALAGANTRAAQAITGLLIDCRGFRIARSSCPKILDESRQEVWGTLNVDRDFVNEKGIVGYYASIEQAQTAGRVGNNPMVVKAISVGGPKQFPSDPVIGAQDAERITSEDARWHFLDRLAVGFIVD